MSELESIDAHNLAFLRTGLNPLESTHEEISDRENHDLSTDSAPSVVTVTRSTQTGKLFTVLGYNHSF